MSLIKQLDTDSLANNLQAIQSLISPHTVIAPCLKSNAYGHGLLQIAESLTHHQIEWVCLNSVEEAFQLSQTFPHFYMLIIGLLQAQSLYLIPKIPNLRVTIYDPAHLHWLEAIRPQLQTSIKVHIKVDTGMSRQGFEPNQAIEFLTHIRDSYPWIHVEGIYTHFATASDIDPHTLQSHPHYLEQKNAFNSLINQLNLQQLLPPFVHAANSAALLTDPDVIYNFVRPGLALYGYYPSNPVQKLAQQRNVHLVPVLKLYSYISHLKTVPAQSCVSYGCTHVTDKTTTIAILPLGYSDGMRLELSNHAHVLIKGQSAPIIGRITMNMTMVDVTDIPDVRVGDEVVIIGTQGDQTITADQHASLCNTINYEILCGFK